MTASVVDHAIASRMSVRAFTGQPVARADIEAILQVASRAPSGTCLLYTSPSPRD